MPLTNQKEIHIADHWTENTVMMNASGMELMRVQKNDGLFHVQSYNEQMEKWITQKVHKDLNDAVMDCAEWYAEK